MKFLLGGPFYRSQVDARLMESWITLILAGASLRHECLGTVFEDALLDLARNKLMLRALDSGADWLISTDADTGLAGGPNKRDAANATFRALEETSDRDVAIVGFPMPRGNGGCNVVDLDRTEPKDWPTKRREVLGVGTGAIAFRLDWYRTHWPRTADVPWFQTVMFLQGGQLGYVGEDFGHCAVVSQRGGKVIIDPRAKWEHYTRRAGT